MLKETLQDDGIHTCLILCYAVKLHIKCERGLGFVLVLGFFFLFPSLFNLFYCSVTFSKTCCNLAGTVGNHKGEQKKDLTPMEPKVSLKVFSNTPDDCLPHISYLQYRGSSIHCLENLIIFFYVWCLRSLFPRTEIKSKQKLFLLKKPKPKTTTIKNQNKKKPKQQ